MKFAELGLLSPTNKNLPIIKKNIVLKGKNAYEFEQQLEKLDNFINKNWGFDIDDNGRGQLQLLPRRTGPMQWTLMQP